MRLLALLTALVVTGAGTATAEKIRVLTAGSLQRALAVIVESLGIGIAVRTAADVGNFRTVEELEALLLAADSVVYNRGSSGVYSQSMIESIGVAERIASRTTQYANGGQVLSHVIEGEGRDLGFAPLTEIRANEPNGVSTIVLPATVQNYTAYSAALTTGAVEPRISSVYLTTTIARDAFIASGVD